MSIIAASLMTKMRSGWIYESDTWGILDVQLETKQRHIINKKTSNVRGCFLKSEINPEFLILNKLEVKAFILTNKLDDVDSWF